jgi:hypothetical protein
MHNSNIATKVLVVLAIPLVVLAIPLVVLAIKSPSHTHFRKVVTHPAKQVSCALSLISTWGGEGCQGVGFGG